ncbi:MAG: NADH-quinone oxidoreductase subunit NuoN, partial [Hyphomicrobium sp.]
MQQILSIFPIFPEIVLSFSSFLLLMVSVFRNEDQRNGSQCCWVAVIIMLLLAFYLIAIKPPTQIKINDLINNIVIYDAFTVYTSILILVSASIALLIGLGYFSRAKILKFEIPVIILLSTTGMLLMVSSNDLISVYLSIELMSLPLYVLATIDRDNVQSSEAGLKYFVLGALSSGMFLYGASLIYGITGSTSFENILSFHSQNIGDSNLIFIFGLVFLLVGFAFKISAVPFHMWTPDVYEGSPTPVTAFFSAAPKLAAFALLVRILFQAFGNDILKWQQIIVFLSILSLLLGTFGAIGQSNIKRLFAYSTISHIGFCLIGLAVGSEQGVSAVLIYLTIYLTMSLGGFACILAMREENGQLEKIDALSGISEPNLFFAIIFTILLFSLAGIPPLAGFFAKFYILESAIKGGYMWLAIFAILMSVVGSFYYLRIIKIMFFDENKNSFIFSDLSVYFVMIFAAL